MSRCSLKVKAGAKIPGRSHLISEVVVGLDHHLGWFAQVFEHGVEEPFIDIPKISHRYLRRSERSDCRGYVLSVLDRYCDMSDRYTSRVQELIVLDLDPGEVPRGT